MPTPKNPTRAGWSLKYDRELIVLAKTHSLKAIAEKFDRPMATIVRRAARLGLSIRGKVKEMSHSRPARRPWTADEEKKLDELVEAGKDTREMAVALQRTRQAIYSRLHRVYRKRPKERPEI
jgi:transposase